ncbi:M15 family metallopeptidase [Microbacterium sp. SORGH_AS_0862]|uniref:M15 family metallopeptidase n=1 Tax=Microbacterium sp. SORGH_AS_0862 TaxID=3041789 RepID=UPI0027906B46|nr:M15 family metallopeptidase [Microbacterium sp. SORGH_AS_0862]MDQ1204921.1 D-alanyl-D-alanine carboxypeptidase [Microbacterium sp. SORGH_AS_0862]
MHSSVVPASVIAPARSRRLVFAVMGLVAAMLLAALAGVWLRAVLTTDGSFAPDEASGLIRGDQAVTVADDHLPAIAGLDAGLRDAMRAATADAAGDGVALLISSGWRSEAYQRWLLGDAIRYYGDEETARQFVATPEASQHVTGDAVDIGPLDGQLWLGEHGAAYGLCQTYANERWHFELATTPGGTCPDMRADATS